MYYSKNVFHAFTTSVCYRKIMEMYNKTLNWRPEKLSIQENSFYQHENTFHLSTN